MITIGNNKDHRSKKYYPSKKKKHYYPHHKKSNPPNLIGGFFNGNLVNGMRFGGKDHDLSGYVERRLYIRQKDGTIIRGNEKQFFNSGRQLGRVLVHDDESNF